MSEYFETVATQWDEMRTQFFSDQIRDKAYILGGIQKGHFVADIGAGTGFLTEGLLKLGCKVIAIDQAEGMLKEMQHKFSDSTALQVVRGDVDHIPVADTEVDAAMCNMVLHHAASPLNMIREMTRIVKPEGKVIISDLDEHTHHFLMTEQHDRWMGFKREAIREWFEEAGLKSIEIIDAECSCCATSSACTCDDAKISVFIAMGIKSR